MECLLRPLGSRWADEYWRLVEGPNGVLAVGLGSDMQGNKGKRPRATSLALAAALRLERRRQMVRHMGAMASEDDEVILGDPRCRGILHDRIDEMVDCLVD